MSNTFRRARGHTTEELVKEVKHGIYFKSFTEWNIDTRGSTRGTWVSRPTGSRTGQLGEM